MMAKHTYKITSDEGSQWLTPAEVGDTVELDLSAEQAQAVTAAGWVEKVEPKKKEH